MLMKVCVPVWLLIVTYYKIYLKTYNMIQIKTTYNIDTPRTYQPKATIVYQCSILINRIQITIKGNTSGPMLNSYKSYTNNNQRQH